MPLLATFLGWAVVALANFFGRWMLAQTAMRIAGYVVFLSLVTGFTLAVSGCLTLLSGYLTGGSGGGSGGESNWSRYFWIGLGIFIPANAGGIMSCLASVWVACQVFKMQKIGVLYWGRG
ncbi:hypothetical protein SAMN05216567_116149 [Variovorax sp. OK605]|uniref:hypothetical protein n=1 Tax=Variovorax sp. OK605 TaxID=1855317 RepID=UPI0008E42FAC|nr:hypothetical protein [Variovorax sp. OK605]SFQ45802.1 hypothetical protein SAMN05216567_116149 [Variovorax sp. OK605]